MSEENEIVGPDPIVSTALKLLPVPEHEDGFWSRFGSALDAEPEHRGHASGQDRPEGGPGPSTAEVPVLELVSTDHLALVPRAVRRRSNVALSAVAVAAAIVVVVAAASLVRSRTGDDGATETAGETETTEGADDGGSTDTTLSTLTAPEGEPAATAVVEWVTALSEGDMDTAWSALSETARSDWGDKATFAAERTSFAEGYSAWAHTEPQQILVSNLTSSGDGEIVVVTLVGMVEQEGVSNLRADAFPVRIVDGEATLDLDPFSSELEFVVPEPMSDGGTRPTVTDGSLVIVVPEDAAAPAVRLDSGDVFVCGQAGGTELTPLDGGYGQRCEFTPPAGLEPGFHVFTAAYLSSDGTDVTAQSVVFEAA